MKKFNINIALSLLIFFSIYSFSLAEIVKKIEINGNERVSSQSIEMFSKINVGDDIKKDDLNKILKNVYDSNFFQC